MAARTKKLGPRVTVSVGRGKNGKAIHSFMLKATAELFGFQALKDTNHKSKNNRVVSFRGSKSNAIKVPTGKTKKVGKVTRHLYKSIPMPGEMNIPKIQVFLKKATKNKPDHFVTSDGQTHSVA